MESNRINYLVEKFNSDSITAEEQRELEQLIETGTVDIAQLHSLSDFENKIQKLDFGNPGADLDARFYQMLSDEKGKTRNRFSLGGFFTWPQLAPKLAFAAVALIAGFLIGYLAKPSENADVKLLAQEVTDLKEMMMLSLLEKESATERLRAVNLTQEMDYASTTVTGALIKTLNNDENVNVRLAALEALAPYVKDSNVRQELIRSISLQKSPLVQIALAELMAKIQEKSSIKELEKVMKSERTPTEVKNRIKQSIKSLS